MSLGKRVLRGFARLLLPLWWPWWQLWRAWRWAARGVYRLRRRLVRFFTDPPTEQPFPDALSTAVQQPQQVLEHLLAFRPHLFRALIAFFLATFLSFAFLPTLIEWLTRPIGGLENLQAIGVTEPLGVTMRVAVLSGFILSLPYIYLELYAFIAPGLYPRTRVWALLMMPVVLLFFVLGVLFAYFVMLPVALPFLLNFMDIPTRPRPESYFQFVTSLMFWVGLAFEFPLIIYALARLGWVRAKTLHEHTRIIIVGLAVLAAVITPTPDPINMMLVLLPLVALYFLGLGLAYWAERSRARGQASSPATSSLSRSS